MLDSYRTKEWLHVVRAHICTVAVAVSFHSTWRVPRDAFRYGGLTYGLALTVVMAAVALPAALLQLAVGQLCQQDAVGMWRAVPFFKGVGYLRLLISFLGSVGSVIYVALTVMYFLYSINNPMPLWECTDIVIIQDVLESDVYNSSACINITFMEPVAEQPEYYLAIALIIAVLWVILPFALYSPVKFMKRTFYIIAPIVIVLGIVIVSCIADKEDLLTFHKNGDWQQFSEPNIWHAALIQALWSSQIAGGYLVSAGDTIYSNTNAIWSALAIIVTNIAFSWAGSLFWFGISGTSVKDTSAVAVVIQIYNVTVEKSLASVWPLLLFVTLFFSGIIHMFTLLYPLYERFRHVGGHRWRLIAVANSTVACGVALAVLAGRVPALDLLEDVAVPLLISLTTVLEICAFIFVYGWRILAEDVEFLTGRKLRRCWVWGWCASPGIILPFTVWWLVIVILDDSGWTQPPYEASTVISALLLVFVIVVTFAAVSVARQVQYDFLAKLKSSFKPSRHWGPRDPITHYYWLARREDADRHNLPITMYHRRQLGQLSGRIGDLNAPANLDSTNTQVDTKQRANSDDWLYTVYRRQYLENAFHEYLVASRILRSKSLEWTVFPCSKAVETGNFELTRIEVSDLVESLDSVKEDNNIKSVTFASTAAHCIE